MAGILKNKTAMFGLASTLFNSKKEEAPEPQPVERLPTVDKTAMKRTAAENVAQGGRASTMLSVLAKKPNKKLGG